MQFGRSRLIDSSPLERYGTATAFVLVAAVCRVGLGAIVNRPLSAPVFVVAIILSTWLGGIRLGIFASVVSSLILDYFFVQPVAGELDISDYAIRFFLFATEGWLLSWLIDKLRLSSDEITASREELRELAEQQRLVRDSELKRIAREIHDELGQSLTSLKLGIHLLKRKIEGYDDKGSRSVVLSEIDGLSKQVDTTIGAVRRIATELRPSILDDFGLVAAIEWQTNEFAKVSEMECIFSSNVPNIDLDADASTAMFRIFQEALTNIARHAEASRVWVRIDQRDDQIRLCVEDDGKGINAEKMKRTKSLGLLGMRERSRLIGGEITITDSKDGGTRVELVAPVVPAVLSEKGGS